MADLIAFQRALNLVMVSEVGEFWDPNHPDVRYGKCGKFTGYVNDPRDSGGETKFGISKRAYPGVNIKVLDWSRAQNLYLSDYWANGKCHEIMSEAFAVAHFDACVNHGVKRANQMLQLYLRVEPDGIVGPVTLAAINHHTQVNYAEYIGIRRGVYLALNQQAFLNGWLKRADRVLSFMETGAY